MRRGRERRRRPPGVVLGHDERLGLRLLQAELGVQHRDVVVVGREARVDLRAEALGEGSRLVRAADRRQTGPVAGDEQLVVPLEADEGVSPVEEHGAHDDYARRTLPRPILWASFALAPAAVIGRYALHTDATTLFILSGLALIPLAWLIGESTEQAAEHTGPGIGAFLERELRQRPRADHRALRGRRRPAERRARLARRLGRVEHPARTRRGDDRRRRRRGGRALAPRPAAGRHRHGRAAADPVDSRLARQPGAALALPADDPRRGGAAARLRRG